MSEKVLIESFWPLGQEGSWAKFFFLPGEKDWILIVLGLSAGREVGQSFIFGHSAGGLPSGTAASKVKTLKKALPPF